MISILIPVYNEVVLNLLKDIITQCETLKLVFEIILIDDKSNDDVRKENRYLEKKINVIYNELENNIGRSKIRNLLVSKAKYDNLIFLDCDSSLKINSTFISNYFHYINNYKVIYGGTSYQNEKPEFKYRLHWKYGKSIEASNSNARSKKPYESFKTNNFMIKRKVFEVVRFDEDITSYGFEDNKFSSDLKNIGFDIKHIDNPVLHNGLNTNDNFLVKTEMALENLEKLYSPKKIEFTKMVRIYSKIVNYGLKIQCEMVSEILNKYIKRLIYKFPENMVLFQIWKLMVFILKMKKPA